MHTALRIKRLGTLLLLLLTSAAVALGADANRRVLVYTKNGKGYVHDNIAASVAAIKQLAATNNFTVEVSDAPAVFTDQDLKKYKLLIFDNTNNEIFDNEDQKAAFQRYIRAGGAFVGLHSTCGAMRDWPWFWELVGGKFLRHPKMQTFTVKVKDPKDPSTLHLPASFPWTDEFYFLDHLALSVHVLLAGDLTSLDDPAKEKYPGTTFGDQFPLAWRHEFEGARAWYTALGHKAEHYSDPKLSGHILGGILWAMGDAQ
jgi:uncharacterized protein